MSDSGFFQLLHDFMRSDELMSAPLQYRWVILVLMDRVAHSPCIQNDHGTLIDLLPGQVILTTRLLAKWAGVSDSCAYRTIKYFEKLKIVKQEVKHTKTIVTVLQGIKLTTSETGNETKVKQDRNTKEEIQYSSSVVVVVSREDEKQIQEQAKEVKSWLDKQAMIERKRITGPYSETTIWGETWILPINLFENLIRKWGPKYFYEQLNYMCRHQLDFDKGKGKKSIVKPDCFLIKACNENFANAKSILKAT
jgi:actin-related protein